jgi:hypothetical protein
VEPQSLDVGTSYRVFQLVPVNNGGRETWAPVNTVTARTAELAIKIVVARLAEKDQKGTFAATPSRSWTAFTVKTQTETKIVLGEAKP